MLQKTYEEKVRSVLAKKLGRGNQLSVPTLEKVVVSMGVGSNKDNEQFISDGVQELETITGQRPVVRKARIAESGFKLRKGETVGLQVTLRGKKMWDFLEKVINVALPRVRDFRGVSPSSFDGHGNYNIGLTEHQVFPEVDVNKLRNSKGIQITIVTPPWVGDEDAYKLLTELGMPFTKEEHG